ncbi:globin [Fictibacillus nanhaiensis]|uniref:globin domain-containing protein n=1 Tax=Fictibacillus nanhaiensis TaxID=742169 RepID=UPI001C943703|nr:globin [Fictibacillus nanhaiensis]MBY6036314.1 globin [Fictibacillus nanhaiensis]
MLEETKSPYILLGEKQGIEKLVTTFYHLVSEDPLLSPLFPDDLTETAYKQTQFLSQFFGGPPLYTEEHGHPMLRARHMPFPITNMHAKAWLNCMERAMTLQKIQPELQELLLSRLKMTAYHMVNTTGDSERGENADTV